MPELDADGLIPILREVRLVVFDFDGVILESAEIKTRAFVEMFDHVPDHLEAIRRHHLENLGISRFEKFRWILRELLDEEPTPERLERLGDDFSHRVHEAVVACPFVPGARDALGAARATGRPRWVASGTPHDELLRVIRERGLERDFESVHGSPASKTRILRSALEHLDLAPHEALMVGDGTTDRNAARDVGCRFLARSTPEQHDVWLADDEPWAFDLHPLAVALRRSA